MVIHVVNPGDTLYKIGQIYNIDYQKIAYDNQIDPNQPLIGQTLVIIYNDNIKKFREIEVNGYTFPEIDNDLLS